MKTKRILLFASLLIFASLLFVSCESSQRTEWTTAGSDEDFTPAPAPIGTLPDLTHKTPSTDSPKAEETPLADLSAFIGSFGVSSGGRLMTFDSDGINATLTFRSETGVETVSGMLTATDKTLFIGESSYSYAFWGGMLLLNLENQPYILQKDNTVAAPLLKLLSGNYQGDGLTVSGKDGVLSMTLDGIAVSGVPSIESSGKATLSDAESANLALNASATATSVETGGREATFSIDGDMGTRWSSEYKDNQSLILDLGSLNTVGTVRIFWETAAGKDYDILLSADGENWISVAPVKGNVTANEWLAYTFEPKLARYVKMDGHTRVGEYGFSIYEIEVYHRYSPALSFTCVAEAEGIALTLNGTTYHLKEAK